MRSAQQPTSVGVKKTVWLVVHFHGDMAAAVEVGMDLPLKAHRKGTAGLTRVHHIERNGHATF
jgi:hypothetical protein